MKIIESMCGNHINEVLADFSRSRLTTCNEAFHGFLLL